VAVIDEAAPATSWITTGEASRRLAMSSQWARVQATRGVLRTVSTPLGLLFDPESVERLRHTRAAGSPAPHEAA